MGTFLSLAIAGGLLGIALVQNDPCKIMTAGVIVLITLLIKLGDKADI